MSAFAFSGIENLFTGTLVGDIAAAGSRATPVASAHRAAMVADTTGSDGLAAAASDDAPAATVEVAMSGDAPAFTSDAGVAVSALDAPVLDLVGTGGGLQAEMAAVTPDRVITPDSHNDGGQGGSCGPIDFIFLQDLSGSYADDLPILQSQIASVIATVEDIDPMAQFGVASFIDKPTGGFGSTGDYVYRTDLAVTDDDAAVIAMMDALYTLSGADAPEAQLEALLQVALRGAELGFRADSEKIVMLSTDASYHVAGDHATAGANNGDAVLDGSPEGTGEDYPDIVMVATALAAAGIFPVFSVTADQLTVYQDLVDQLGTGAVIQLTSNSDNFADAVSLAIALNCGDVTHEGTEDDDEIEGSEREDGIFGKGGDDFMRGHRGDDTMDGGSGNDEVRGGRGRDELRGGTGDDNLFGNGSHDVLSGGLGNDTLTGGRGRDVFIVNPGDGWDSILDFEDGRDLLDLSAFKQYEGVQAVEGAVDTADGLMLSLPDGTRITLAGITSAQLGLDDVIVNSETDAPTAVADSGLTTGTETVVIDVTANDYDINGDTVAVSAVGTAGHGTVTIVDGDNVSYTADEFFVGTDSFSYTISDGDKTSTNWVSVTVLPDLIGDDDPNTLIGTAASELAQGFGGADLISAMGGFDTIEGGDGNDTIDGGTEGDLISGGAGDDSIYGGANGDDSVAGPAGDVIDAGSGNDTVVTGLESDTIAGGTGNDDIDGGAGDDLITGDDGADDITGGAGDDKIEGGAGKDLISAGADNDEIFGGGGKDTIDGGAGDDQIESGNGDDLITGGTGADEFTFRLDAASDIIGDDIITDFNAAEDILILDGDGRLTFTDTTDGALVSHSSGGSILVLNVLVADLLGATEM